MKRGMCGDEASKRGRDSDSERVADYLTAFERRGGKSVYATRRAAETHRKSLFACANHAVAIEPISGRGYLADFLRSNVAELPKNPPERTGNQLQKERYYRKFRAPRAL